MLELIKAYQRLDPAANSKLEILLLYPGIKAIFFHRMAHFLQRYNIPFIPRMLSELARWLTGIEIHPAAQIGEACVIDHGFGVVIGETAIVGNRVVIYQGVTLGGRQLVRGKRHPTIEDDVIIGAGSKILGNIVIGKKARIGANSVVLTDVPAMQVVAGIPARIITKDHIEYYI